jgi:hypothetical protein
MNAPERIDYPDILSRIASRDLAIDARGSAAGSRAEA